MIEVRPAAALQAFAVLSLILLATPAAAQNDCGSNAKCSDNARRYEVTVLCDDAAVSDAETVDTLTLTAWNGNELLTLRPWNGVACSGSHKNAYPLTDIIEKPVTHFILETSGDDAFFADWITITEIEIDRYGSSRDETRIAQYGAPGGRGYCLSRDPNDLNGAWATASDHCNAAIRLKLSDQKVYASPPTYLALFEIGLDCVHSGLTATLPWASMTITAYDSNGMVVAQNTQEHRFPSGRGSEEQQMAEAMTCSNDQPIMTGGSLPRQAHGLGQFIASDVAAIEISIGELDRNIFAVGNDKARLFIDQLALFRDYAEVAHWGQNEAQGWCLSPYPETSTGLWHSLAPDGCLPGVRFDAVQKTWSPLAAP